MLRISFCLFLLLLSACGNKEESSSSVYIAGEIVNPTSTHVYLYKNDIEIDSARLDENNRFEFQIDSINEGLHHFQHAPEYQYLFLEEGDSLVMRLNTRDFDESLVFSGKGESINNFMLEMFLEHEAEESTVNSYYVLSPEAFDHKIDSLRREKLDMMKRMINTDDLSNEATQLARASVNFNYYIHKELYPFYHKKRTGTSSVPELPGDFYDYRKGLDLNNATLTYFRPYYKFINYHLSNLTYMTCLERCNTRDHTIKNYLHFNRHKLGLIDSLITQKELRDNVFRYVAMDYFLKVNDNEANNLAFIEEFRRLNSENRHKEEIDNLYNGIQNIQPNKPLPSILVKDQEGQQKSLKEIANDKKVVFYFWTEQQTGHFDNMATRVKELSRRYPNYQFIGINFETEPRKWKAMIASKGLDADNQFRSENFQELTNSLVVYPLTKVVIAENSHIVNGFASLNEYFYSR